MTVSVRTNAGETDSYNIVDHFMSRAVRSLSRVLSVKTVTRPFWNRWRASQIGEELLDRFLLGINSIDEWPGAALRILDEVAAEADLGDSAGPERRVETLRRLSYIAHLAQWGCLALGEQKTSAYLRSRDYYLQAEALAFGDRFRRIEIPFEGRSIFGNLHLPRQQARPAPLAILVHGMDDTKEEHLATEVALAEAGFATLTIDGPGQGESLFVDGITWPANFHDCVTATIDAVEPIGEVDCEAVGLVGISWGGLWALKSAAVEPRVRAVYDLGGPVDASRFARLPYFLKTKYCQVLGVTSPGEIPEAYSVFSLNDEELRRIRVPVRIVHGGKDPLVRTRDKEWLRNRLLELHADADVSMKVFADGDHCCTGHAVEMRVDVARFFDRTLR